MDKNELKKEINDTIYDNLYGDISGESLNGVLNDMVDTLAVDANPPGDAVGQLDKIGIGGKVYSNPPGPQGPQGEQGQQGQQGPKGPQGEQGPAATNPFKGWWPDLASLKAAHTATPGDSAYVKDIGSDTWSIYVYSSSSTDEHWTDSGTNADTTEVQTFQSGQQVNQVSIVDNLNSDSPNDVLSATQGKILDQKLNVPFKSVNMTEYVITGWINPTYPNILNTAAGYSRSILIPIDVFSSNLIKIITNSDYDTQIAFIKTLTDTVWAGFDVKSIEYANSTALQTIDASSTYYFQIPSETNYVYVNVKEALSSAAFKTPKFIGESFDWYGSLNDRIETNEHKLGDVSFSERKYDVDVLTDVHNGYVNSDGSISGTGSDSIQYVAINVEGYDRVRFLGVSRESGSTYCAFYDKDDNLIGSTYRMDHDQPATTFKEYKLNVPAGAVIFKTAYKSSAISGLEDVFYCYLQTGYTAASTFGTGEYLGNVGINGRLAPNNNLPTSNAIINGTARKMFNPPVDLKKENLKILDIGNSYTDDSTHYIDSIIGALNLPTIDFSFYKYIRPSGSYKTALDCYNGVDEGVLSPYYVVFEAGNTLPTVDVQNVAANDGGAKFRKLLDDTDWDIIIIHQVSDYATNYSVWQGDGNGGYLNQFIQLLRKTNPQASIGSMIIHSYSHEYSGAGPTLDRWGKIADAIKQFTLEYGIDFIIPYGTAVECMRLSTLNDGSDFCIDDHKHLASGIGDYVANCVYYQCVFAPRFGISILGNAFRHDPSAGTGVVPINDTTAPLAQKAAMWAAYNWYEVVNADDL